MEQKKWENEYPQMPESFHQVLKDVVERQCEAGTSDDVRIDLQDLLKKRNEMPLTIRKKKNWKKIYTFGIAAALTMGIAVAGVTATQMFKEKEAFDLAEYLGYESRGGIEELFQTDIEVTIAEEAGLPLLVNDIKDDKEREQYIYWWESNQKERENNEPLMEIQEIMYDGLELTIYAVTTDIGEEYELWADGVNIGGTGVALSHGGKIGEGRECVFETHLSNVERQTPFEVTIPLGVYKNGQRYENQDYTFTVTIDAEMTKLPEQEFVLNDWTIRVSELVKSRTAILGKVEVIMTEEQKETYESNKRAIFMPLFKSTDGTIWQSINTLETGPYNIIYNPGKLEWYFHEKMPLPDAESVMIYLTAYEKSANAEKFDVWNPENIWGEGVEISLAAEKDFTKSIYEYLY